MPWLTEPRRLHLLDTPVVRRFAGHRMIRNDVVRVLIENPREKQAMRSPLTVGTFLLCGWGLFAASSQNAWARDRQPCERCEKDRATSAEVELDTDKACCEEFEDCVVTQGQAILVLNCPNEALVSINRNPTTSIGVTRQYHLTFDAQSPECRVKIWLCNKDGEVAHTFRASVRLRDHQTVVLRVSRQEMATVVEKSPRIKPKPDATVPKLVPPAPEPASNK